MSLLLNPFPSFFFLAIIPFFFFPFQFIDIELYGLKKVVTIYHNLCEDGFTWPEDNTLACYLTLTFGWHWLYDSKHLCLEYSLLCLKFYGLISFKHNMEKWKKMEIESGHPSRKIKSFWHTMNEKLACLSYIATMEFLNYPGNNK